MFTAVAHKKLDSAEGYFVEHLSQNDYYAAGEIRPGQWIGTGAERLALKGEVTRESFLQANAVAGQRFINGELVQVKEIHGDNLLLGDGRVIPETYRTFTHGYALTSHAAQGKTAEVVLVVASARSLPAINQRQFYVSISRGREACQVFTDDRDLLRAHVTHSSVRPAAVEVIPHARKRRVLQTIVQRGYRFVKEFRQRLARSETPSLQQDIRPIESLHYERQHKSSQGISV